MRRFYAASRNLAVLSTLIIIVTLLAGCAEKKHGKTFQRGTRTSQKDIIRPAEAQKEAPESVSSPQRAASNQLVDKGLNYMDAKNYELAAVRFQDAINIDPRNGIAYYYLAMSDYYMGQSDEALGLLDKAQALIGYDERWNERIENLRASILAEEATSVKPSQPI